MITAHKGGRRKSVHLRLTPQELAVLDYVRGAESRSDELRRLLAGEVHECTLVSYNSSGGYEADDAEQVFVTRYDSETEIVYWINESGDHLQGTKGAHTLLFPDMNPDDPACWADFSVSILHPVTPAQMAEKPESRPEADSELGEKIRKQHLRDSE